MNARALTVAGLAVLIAIGVAFWIAGPGTGEDEVANPTVGAGEPAADRSEGTVEIVLGGFRPQRVEAFGAATITFINRSEEEHAIDFRNERIADSGRIAPGGSYTVQMPGMGEYAYSCTVHPDETGTVVVPE